nr:PREDICTED: transient receptor potential cation channel subfamily V member 3 [Latimeria chalumnae]|eukprot:XP_006010864.2 PREDICTED: transient receptor potential cation channel subfamily V member 3 [Latimeria chalumnae]
MGLPNLQTKVTPKGIYCHRGLPAAVIQNGRGLSDGHSRVFSISHQVKSIFIYKALNNENGKTCLMKALLNMNDKTRQIVTQMLSFAEDRGFQKELVNAEFTSKYYKGQTALHIAIERRHEDIVKLLIQKGADVNVKANGEFFRNKETGFYFGETPLALAVCTKQKSIVDLLLDHEEINLKETDQWGNTVLHALVSMVDDSEDHYLEAVYKAILEKYSEKYRKETLEHKTNGENLTPVQLAAKLGKRKILEYILSRELKDEKTLHLSRKLTDWVYGPLCSSLYDLNDLDTSKKNSVLHLIVYNSKLSNRHEMLEFELLKTLLNEKWKKFVSHMFYIGLFIYFIYNVILTLVSYYRPYEDKFPAPLDLSGDIGRLYLTGQVFVFICAIYLMLKEKLVLSEWADLKSFLSDEWFRISFWLQAMLVILSSIIYWIGLREYLILLVLAMSLGWTNMLYYTRGFQSLGIYSVMIQKVILNDVLKFLLIYVLFLLGYGVALASLVKVCSDENECSPYSSFQSTVLELFKLTLGLGDLELQKHSLYPELFLALLVLYVLLTFRARTILNLEGSLLKFPRKLRPEFLSKRLEMGEVFKLFDTDKRYFRLNDLDWDVFNKKITRINEDPGKNQKLVLWNFTHLVYREFQVPTEKMSEVPE